MLFLVNYETNTITPWPQRAPCICTASQLSAFQLVKRPLFVLHQQQPLRAHISCLSALYNVSCGAMGRQKKTSNSREHACNATRNVFVLNKCRSSVGVNTAYLLREKGNSRLDFIILYVQRSTYWISLPFAAHSFTPPCLAPRFVYRREFILYFALLLHQAAALYSSNIAQRSHYA